MTLNGDRITKSYSVFDCDAHINDPHRDLGGVRPEGAEGAGPQDLLAHGPRGHGSTATRRSMGGGNARVPGVQPDLHRRTADEQEDHAEAELDDAAHRGAAGVRAARRRAYDARGRISEMDLMGIDQVLVIPTMVIMNVPFARTPRVSTRSARPTTIGAATGATRSPTVSTARPCCRFRIRSWPLWRSGASRTSASRSASSGRSTRAARTPTTSAGSWPTEARRRGRWTSSSAPSRRRASCSGCTPSRRA